MDFIEDKMNDIFEDFKSEVECLESCCMLKKLRFNNGNIPDYSIQIIQQLYLLRYFPAYFIEYYDIYRALLSKDFVDSYKVLSIGTGCGVDYYGLYFALKERDASAVDDICYTGIDLIEWSYRDTIGNDWTYFINEDITQWKSLDWDGYNIIIFPKSIGEFTDDDFSKLLNIFKNSDFTEERIFLVSSIREQNDSIDTDRMEQIINVFEKEHSYHCLDDKSTYTYYRENVGLAKYFKEFNYPHYTLEYITSLIDKCKVYEENWFESCEQNCATLLNKYPILRTGHIKYQIKRLERNTIDEVIW
jgi:hypothetical protein